MKRFFSNYIGSSGEARKSFQMITRREKEILLFFLENIEEFVNTFFKFHHKQNFYTVESNTVKGNDYQTLVASDKQYECLYGVRNKIRLEGKQEFRRTDFGSKLLAAEGEGEEGQ